MFAGVDDMQTGKWVTTGKGKKQTTEFVITTTFNAGEIIGADGRSKRTTKKPISTR